MKTTGAFKGHFLVLPLSAQRSQQLIIVSIALKQSRQITSLKTSRVLQGVLAVRGSDKWCLSSCLHAKTVYFHNGIGIR